MAQRRMFSLQIVDTDAFLEMPASSQLLYFHLSMRADDDGFVDNPKKIMKIIGAADDDMAILITKRFILTFDGGIIVIKHWRINNYIQKDRYQETKYLELKKQLMLKDNSAYTECIQNVSSLDTQVRLGKVSIDKVSSKMDTKKIPVRNNTIITLEDGTKAKLYFGTWVCADNNQVKINTSYYPELKNYDTA